MAVDPSIYERQRNTINNQYDSMARQNALGRFIGQQRGSRTTADYTQNYQREAPKFTASYARRGLTGPNVNSGVYGGAMQRYVADYSQGLNRLYADQSVEQNQFDLNEADYENQRQAALAAMEADKAREIANAAQYLQALRQ